MRLGLVLLPDPVTSAACVRHAASLIEGRRVRVVVGPSALPHVSLLHVETEDDPAALWEQARVALPARLPLDLLAQAFLRYDEPYNAPPAPPGTMAWLIVPASPALRGAEQIALDLPFVRGSIVTTSNGARFQPHVTLAVWDDVVGPGTFGLPAGLVGARDVQTRLALGIMGPDGAHTRTIFEA